MSDLATATPPTAAAPAAPGASTEIIDKATPATPKLPAAEAPKPEAGGKPGEKIESVKKDADPADPAKPFRVKVDGKEIMMSQEEVIARAAKGMAAEKRLQEASEHIKQAKITKAQATQLFQMLKNPETALQVLTNPKLALPFRQIAEKYLADVYKLETMDPKDRELHEAKAKIEEQERRQKEEKEASQKQQVEALQKHYSEQYEKDIMGALETSGLPKSQWTVQQIARYMYLGLQRGVELKATDVIDIVKTEYHKAMTDMLGVLDGDSLISLMGDATVKKVSEALIKRARPNEPRPASQEPSANPAPAAKKLSKEEFRKQLDKKLGVI